MANLNIKITNVDGDNVMVKFNTDMSLKSIDDYDAVAYQPKALGVSTLDDFIASIRDSLMVIATQRDASEQSSVGLDTTGWVGSESAHLITPVAPFDPSLAVASAVTGQIDLATISPEVVL
jgi:hypothetical protein